MIELGCGGVRVSPASQIMSSRSQITGVRIPDPSSTTVPIQWLFILDKV
jgi:hypothetical protein